MMTTAVMAQQDITAKNLTIIRRLKLAGYNLNGVMNDTSNMNALDKLLTAKAVKMYVDAHSGGGGSMVYPPAGIAVSTGSAWGSSIADNSANWNTVLNRQLYTDTSYYDATRWWVNNYAPNIANTNLKLNTNRTLDVNSQNFRFENIGPSLGVSFVEADGFYFSANEFPDFRYGWYDAVSSRGAFEYSALKNKSYIYDGYTQIGLNDEGTYPVLRIGKTPYTNANGRVRLVSMDAADSIEIENAKGSFVLSRMASSRDTLIRAKYDSITLKGKLFDKNIQAGAGTKAVRWNSTTGEFTYADTTAGGGTPAGSNKELQFNNSGSFGGTTAIKYGNTANEILTLWQQSSNDVPLTIKNSGDNSKVAIEIKDTIGSAYTSAIKFTPSAAGGASPSKIYQGYEGLCLEGGSAPYTTAEASTVIIGNSVGSTASFKVHSYPYGVPASPNNWVAKIRTSKTSAVGLAIDWGAAGQTGDLLQFRNNSNTVLAKFDSIGNIYSPASNYSTGGFKYLVRNVTTGKFEKQDALAGSGTYTPTTSGLTNADSTHVFECQYSWITDAASGLKTVTVSGQVEVYINSANTDSRIILSLPIASSFSNEYEAGGTGGVTSASNGLSNHRYSIGVKSNSGSDGVEFDFNPTSGSCNAKINFIFHYKVNPS